MSIIESIGRSVVSPVRPDFSSSAAQDERGMALIKQLVGGGLAVGGGVGLGAALVNLINSLNKEKDLHDPSTLNSDTLYIPVGDEEGREKKASLFPFVAPGIALAGGLTATFAGYSAAQMLWEKIQKERRRRILDEAQNEAVVKSDEEARLFKQSAAAPDAKFNLSDTVLGVPVATALLAALATGGVTMAALNKAFPTLSTKSKSDKEKPRRVRLVDEGATPGEMADAQDVLSKEASWMDIDDAEAAGREFATSFASKVRPTGMTNALINCVAGNGTDRVAGLIKSAGVAALPDILKGWDDDVRQASVEDSQLACMAMHKHAYLSEIAHMLSACELIDAAPHMISASVGDGSEDRLRKSASIASILGMAMRRQNLPGFAAESSGSLSGGHTDYRQALEGALSSNKAPTAEVAGANKSDALGSDTAGTLAHGVTGDAGDVGQTADMIDEVMTGKEKMSVG